MTRDLVMGLPGVNSSISDIHLPVNICVIGHIVGHLLVTTPGTLPGTSSVQQLVECPGSPDREFKRHLTLNLCLN